MRDPDPENSDAALLTVREATSKPTSIRIFLRGEGTASRRGRVVPAPTRRQRPGNTTPTLPSEMRLCALSSPTVTSRSD